MSSVKSFRKPPLGCAFSLLQPKKSFFALNQFEMYLQSDSCLIERTFINSIECDVKCIAYMTQSDISYKEMQNDRLKKRYGG